MGSSLKKKIHKVFKIVDPLAALGTEKIVDPLLANFNLPNSTDAPTPAQQQAKAAQEQADRTAAQAALVAQNATALASNSANDATASVVSGGSADNSAAGGTDLLSRKRGSTVSATLGI